MTAADLAAISPWLLVFAALVLIVAAAARIGWSGTALVVRCAKRAMRRRRLRRHVPVVLPPMERMRPRWGDADTLTLPVVAEDATTYERRH